jgi:hypothetical protein
MGERGGLTVSAKQTLKTQVFQIDVVDPVGCKNPIQKFIKRNFGLTYAYGSWQLGKI